MLEFQGSEPLGTGTSPPGDDYVWGQRELMRRQPDTGVTARRASCGGGRRTVPAGVPRAGQRRPWRAEVDRRQVSLSRGWWPAKPKYTRCGRPWRPARLLSAPARPCCVLCKSQPGPPSVVIVRWRQLTHWAAHLCSHKARPSAQGPGSPWALFSARGRGPLLLGPHTCDCAMYLHCPGCPTSL